MRAVKIKEDGCPWVQEDMEPNLNKSTEDPKRYFGGNAEPAKVGGHSCQK